MMPTGISSFGPVGRCCEGGREIKAANRKWAGTGKGHKWGIREQASSRIKWGVGWNEKWTGIEWVIYGAPLSVGTSGNGR